MKRKLFGLPYEGNDAPYFFGCYCTGDLETANGFDMIKKDNSFTEDGIYEVTFVTNKGEEHPALFYYWKPDRGPHSHRGLVCSIYDAKANADAIIKFSERRLCI